MSERRPISAKSVGHTRRRFMRNLGIGAGTAAVAGTWATGRSQAQNPPIGIPRTLGINDRFDASARNVDALSVFDAVAGFGANTVRFPLRWDWVETREGSLDWSVYNALHQLVVWHGLKALPVIIGAPTSWLSSDDYRLAPNGLAYPISDRALNAYGEFAVAAADRFSQFGHNIEALEVWSEPNNPASGLIDDPGEFSRMLGTVAMFVAARNDTARRPSAVTVVSGGLLGEAESSGWLQYLHGFAKQLMPYSLGIHLYGSRHSTAQNARAYATEFGEAAAAVCEIARAAARTEIWVTAAGATNTGPWGNDGQAEALVALSSVLGAKDCCRAVIVSRLRMLDQAALTEGSDEMSYATSLLDADGAPRPAAAALTEAWIGETGETK